MSDNSSESRVEHAIEQGKRKVSRRMVKLPGQPLHAGSTDSAEAIAKRIQLAKAEKRLKNG